MYLKNTYKVYLKTHLVSFKQKEKKLGQKKK